MQSPFLSPQRVVLAACLSCSIAPTLGFHTARAAPPSATQTVVQNRAKAFYRWYVGGIKRDKYPLDDRTTMRRYVSRRLEKWLYSPALREYGADYFMDAQDYGDDWDVARTSNFRRKGNTADLRVLLGKPQSQGKGMSVQTLQLKWIRENGVWKIDRVNNH